MSGRSLNEIQLAGVVGAGGAGFPSHVKFNAQAEFVIMNAAECEPLMHKDKQILAAYPKECIEGMQMVMDLVGAKKGIFGIKEKYTYVFDALKPLMPDNMEFCYLGNFYPAGDEMALVYEATGRVVAPGQIPLSEGCIVTNTETILNIHRNQPVTTSFLTICGEVNSACTVEALVGSTYAECIEAAGGVTCDDPVMLIGGCMMGQYSEDFEGVVTKTTGGIVVLPRDHDLIRRYLRPKIEYDKIAMASCDQCNFCTELCPRYLLGHPIEPHKNMRNSGFAATDWDLVAGAEFCCECNLCSFYACPEDLDPKNISTDLKYLVKARTEGRLSFEPKSVEHHPMIEYRKAPIPKLMRKLGVDIYDKPAPLKAGIVGGYKVRIASTQHIGAPGSAIVNEGDTVKAGQMIAQPPEGALGSPVHASIAGKIHSLGEMIEIRGA